MVYLVFKILSSVRFQLKYYCFHNDLSEPKIMRNSEVGNSVILA